MGGKIRHAARHGNLAIDDFCSEARQEQIKIGRQPLQRQEVMIDRDIIGHFKYCRPLVDFIKHGNIYRFGSDTLCGEKLLPHKIPFEPGLRSRPGGLVL